MLDKAQPKMDPLQQRAIELLAAGKSVTEAALEGGVSRATLYRWIKNDPDFQAAYNEWQNQLHESARTRLLLAADKAAVTVAKAAESDARIALQLLKSMQILAPKPPGATDPLAIREAAALKEKVRKSEIRQAEQDIKFLDSFDGSKLS